MYTVHARSVAVATILGFDFEVRPLFKRKNEDKREKCPQIEHVRYTSS